MSKLKLLLLLWLMLIGFASGYSQEIVKCIVIETNSGGFIECNLTKHPKLTQNNNVVTLTTDESVTEFSTTDFKKVYFGEDKTLYKLSYFVDGESYKIHKYEVGESITPEAEPTKEGYTFSGWSDIPATMPANDITVTGTFSVNKYKLVYKVDGEEYKGYDVEYGATITPETEPTKEGYTFSGWSDIPATMRQEYKSYDVEYGATITPETEPTKEGYTFSGWSDIPATMPAKDLTITGTFSVNKYKLVYKVDGQEYKSYDVEYGATITPETEPTKEGYTPETEPTKEGYTFSGWSDIPATMPAKDIVITGTYVTGINGVVYSSVLQYEGGYYILNGLDAKEPVIVYAASGEIILRYTASEKGELNIRSSLLSTGVNIIKTKNQSFKVIRK